MSTILNTSVRVPMDALPPDACAETASLDNSRPKKVRAYCSWGPEMKQAYSETKTKKATSDPLSFEASKHRPAMCSCEEFKTLANDDQQRATRPSTALHRPAARHSGMLQGSTAPCSTGQRNACVSHTIVPR